MKASLLNAVDRIKAAGFTHIKVELEGDIGRNDYQNCSGCDGDGYVDCDNCGGEGATSSDERIGVHWRETWEECEDCSGEGRDTCSNCEGEGRSSDSYDEYEAEQFILDYVPSEVRNRLEFGKFYEDGSVDSEFTFTVAIEHCEDVIHWIKAFEALADQCNGLDVDGAGMHIALLRGGHYCGSSYCEECGQLDEAGWRNFREQVTKLLPALFFLASGSARSRVLEYRNPRISNESKYSAIYSVGGKCLEYRVFETCYDKPEAFFDFVEVIANTLKFYADPTLKVKELGKRFGFTEWGSGAVERFYDTPEQLRILNATVKELKPAKSYKKLKEERSFHKTISSMRKKEQERVKVLRKDILEYKRNYMNVMKQPLTAQQIANRDWMMINEGLNLRTANEVVRQMNSLQTLTEFIKRNITSNRYDTFVNC